MKTPDSDAALVATIVVVLRGFDETARRVGRSREQAEQRALPLET
jgi:hypothetical protein